MSELNLLPSVAKFQASKMKLKAKARKASMLIGIGWVMTVVSVFAVWFVFLKRTEVEQSRFDIAQNDFSSLKGEILLTQQLKFKAKLIGQILGERFEYSSVFQMIKSLFSSDIVIDKTEIEDRSTIMARGGTKKITGIDELEEKSQAAKVGQIEGLTAINIKNLTYDAANGWIFDLEIKLK